jgi:integrase/recombinase XerD
MSTPQVEAFLEMMAVERDASPHTLSAYGRDLADAEAGIDGGLMGGDEAGIEAWYADLAGRRPLATARCPETGAQPAKDAQRRRGGTAAGYRCDP